MHQMIADVPQFDVTYPVVKAVVLLACLVPWLRFAPWVDRDADKLFGSATTWNAVVLGAGAAGVAVWLMMPFYVVGLLFYAVLAAGGLIFYVAYRNGRVDPKKKVLTREHLFGALKKRRRSSVEILTRVTIYEHNEKLVMPPDMTKAEPEEIETYNLVQELLHDLVWRRAGEVVMTPAKQRARVVYVIDGVATERPALDLADGERIIQFIKRIGGMDVEERRQPQKGAVSVDFLGNRADMNVSTAGTTGGQRLIFRVVQEVVRTRLDELGMPDDVREEIDKLTEAPNGLFLVSGRRGSGVTSTLYAMLRGHDAYIKNIVTVESTPAVDLENITQHAYDEDDSKVPKMVNAVMQRGVDVLMVDKCPDTETAKLLVQAAAKHPVLLGMHAGDSFSALARWVKLCGEPTPAARILRGVLCQMLMRRLCDECKEAYRPDPKSLAKLNLAAEKIDQFYRPGEPKTDEKKGEVIVCENCQGSGYCGRVAAFELLKLTKEIRQLIIAGATVSQIRAACRKNQMLYLQEQALRKVIDGSTSVQEVIRATQQAKKK